MEKEIKKLEEQIKKIEKTNPYSGELSFLYYQLNELKKEIENAN